MTSENKNAIYTCVNYSEAVYPTEIKKQSICIRADIADVIQDLVTS